MAYFQHDQLSHYEKLCCFSNVAKEGSTFSFLFELLKLMFDHPESSIFSFQSTNVAHQQLSNFPINIITIIAIFLNDQRQYAKYLMPVQSFPTESLKNYTFTECQRDYQFSTYYPIWGLNFSWSLYVQLQNPILELVFSLDDFHRSSYWGRDSDVCDLLN